MKIHSRRMDDTDVHSESADSHPDHTTVGSTRAASPDGQARISGCARWSGGFARGSQSGKADFIAERRREILVVDR